MTPGEFTPKGRFLVNSSCSATNAAIVSSACPFVLEPFSFLCAHCDVGFDDFVLNDLVERVLSFPLKVEW